MALGWLTLGCGSESGSTEEPMGGTAGDEASAGGGQGSDGGKAGNQGTGGAGGGQTTTGESCPAGEEVCNGACVPANSCAAVAAACDRPAELTTIDQADHVIGDGSPASCTEAALQSAITQGGSITFDCGPEPHTIALTKTLTLRGEKNDLPDVTIDGEDKITLDGQGKVRILSMPHWWDRAEPTLRVQRLRFVNGKASGTPHEYGLGTNTDGGGGAIYHKGGTLIVVGCQFENNEGALVGPDVAGGAIFGTGAGSTVVVDSVIRGNRCANGGALGGLGTSIHVANTAIVDNEATGYGANAGSKENQVGHGGNGGAIVMDGRGDRLFLCGTSLMGNRAGALGAAIFRTGYDSNMSKTGLSEVVIERTSIRGNEASTEVTVPDGEATPGGALYLQGVRITIEETTIADNVFGRMAAVWIEDHPGALARLDMTNVTVTGNESLGFGPHALAMGGTGGGTLQNCTFAHNQGAALAISGNGQLTVNNSILQVVKCKQVSSGSNNLQWPTAEAACVSGATFADPQLGPLEDNGGPTMTRAPASGSPAIGAGQGCSAIDQRGTPRAAACTLGAYEVE